MKEKNIKSIDFIENGETFSIEIHLENASPDMETIILPFEPFFKIIKEMVNATILFLEIVIEYMKNMLEFD